MKRISGLVAAVAAGLCMFGAVACSGGGCGTTEEDLDEESSSATNNVTTTCGPGTHQEGNTCVPNSNTTATTLSN